jgi:hypothetical protein
VNATTDGVVLVPSALGTTLGSPPSHTAITELVVPRSMPTALAIGRLLAFLVSSGVNILLSFQRGKNTRLLT